MNLIVTLLKSLVILWLSVWYFLWLNSYIKEMSLYNNIDFIGIDNTYNFIETSNKAWTWQVSIYWKVSDIGCPWITDPASLCHSTRNGTWSILCLTEIKNCYYGNYNWMVFKSKK
jgi:hypothetical protein